jgi:hypothetical protein
MHGGALTVRSILGSGSLFQMILPAAQLVVPAAPNAVVPTLALRHHS